MSRLSKGYKRIVDKIWGRVAKIGFWGQKPRFQAQKNDTKSWPRTGKIVRKIITLFAKRKSGRFSVIPAGTIVILGHFFDGQHQWSLFFSSKNRFFFLKPNIRDSNVNVVFIEKS